MINRHSALIRLATLLLVTTCHSSTASNVQVLNDTVDFMALVHRETCKDEQSIGMALQQLSSGDYNQTLPARDTLLKVAHDIDGRTNSLGRNGSPH